MTLQKPLKSIARILGKLDNPEPEGSASAINIASLDQ